MSDNRIFEERERWYEQWSDAPTMIGLTLYIEDVPHWSASEPKRWTPDERRAFCNQLRQVIAVVDQNKRADVVYQGNNTPDDKLPTSVIVWLNGWYADPTPEDRFRHSYSHPDPFGMRKYLEQMGYHVSMISFGYDPVMA